ncbi:hypothetical protein N7524_003930 [Penicillium chrysogenum]|nr:hypothetical protein N7524_003930 [Penicillium chrysogenum]
MVSIFPRHTESSVLVTTSKLGRLVRHLDAIALHTIGRGAENSWLSKLGLPAALAPVHGMFLVAGANFGTLDVPSWKNREDDGSLGWESNWNINRTGV